MFTSAAATELEIGERPRPRPKELKPSRSSRELLEALALAGDATSNRQIGLERVWGELLLGQCRIVDTFSSPGRSFLISVEARDFDGKGTRHRRILPRQLELLEAVLLGATQKAVALEARMSVSTMSTSLKRALADLGLSCSASKVPAIVVALVSAARVVPRKGRESIVTHGKRRYRVVSVERPDLALARLLSPAEYVATRLLIEGEHHNEIARRRNASPRTIANQIGSAFRRLRVSGRSELLAALLRGTEFPTDRRDFSAVRTSA